ncbi:MAG: myxosortase MrtC [Sandaracinaceae bacterium]
MGDPGHDTMEDEPPLNADSQVVSSGEPTTQPIVPGRPLLETVLVFAGVTAVTAAITWAPRVLPGMLDYAPILVGGLFLGVAMKLAQRESGGMRRHGIDLAGMLVRPDASDPRPAGPLGVLDLARSLQAAALPALRETGVALLVAAVVFPPFVLGFWYWNTPTQPFSLTWPESVGSFVLTQLLVVALPEEALFRGTFQTRLHDRWPPARRLRITIDPRAWILTALLFALVHFVSIPHPARLAVFFPGLLFGLLRAWRGGIGAALLLHAMSNLLSEMLELGWGLR